MADAPGSVAGTDFVHGRSDASEPTHALPDRRQPAERASHRLHTQAITIPAAASAGSGRQRPRSSGDDESSPRRPRTRPTGPARPVVLGILNVTPDSFSDGGVHAGVDQAVEFAAYLFENGADLIDVGGESSRPGAHRIPVEEEQRRVLPVLRELADRGIPFSVDTVNSSTAKAAAALGAAVINDVSGGSADEAMARVVADSGVMFVAMHSRGPSATMTQRAVYRDTVGEVRRELQRRVAELIAAGIDPERIVVDPGLGFAKDSAQNWQLLGALQELSVLGLPVLVGASRKRFLGELLAEGAPMRRRDAATAVISALAADAGAWGVRVHDVEATRAALDVWSAMKGVDR